MKTLPPVALGTWSWGTGFAGGDTVFGNHLSDTQMAEVFTAAMSKGLNLWDTNERTINNLVIVEVKPEFQSEFRNIVLPEMVESLKVEKGVLAMYAGTDSETPKRWYFYEIYASEEDYQLHRQTLHFLDYLRQTAHMSARKDAIPVKPVFLRNKGGIKQEPQR